MKFINRRISQNFPLNFKANFVPWNRMHVDGWVFTRSLWQKVRGCSHFYCRVAIQ